MRSECLDSKYAYDRRLPISRLVSAVGDSILFLTFASLFKVNFFKFNYLQMTGSHLILEENHQCQSVYLGI